MAQIEQKISPFLWLDGTAEAAMNLYTSIFPNSEVGSVSRAGEGMHIPAGTVMTANFTLAGLNFVALNGGDYYKLTPAVSFLIRCEDQAEVDHFWNALVEGGSAMQCGWLTDKFGVTWQVIPVEFFEMISDEDPAKVGRVMQAMMQMVRFDIAGLRAAYNNA